MSDLRQRVPGHSLIDELLHQWDLGTIYVDNDTVVIDDEAVSWYRGVIGERRVASVLEQLDESYLVLHSIPVGRKSADIDHVVISQAGVVTINTKYSPGKPVWVAGRGLLVDGHKTPYVTNALREARRASELLSRASGLTVPVMTLIVFVKPGYITRKAPAGGDINDPEVRVIADVNLIRNVVGRAIFSPEQVARIADAAVQPSTWHESPATSSAGDHISREFTALEDAVGARLSRPSYRWRPAPASRAPRDPARTAAPTQQRRSRRPSRAGSCLALLISVAGFVGLFAYLTSLTPR